MSPEAISPLTTLGLHFAGGSALMLFLPAIRPSIGPSADQQCLIGSISPICPDLEFLINFSIFIAVYHIGNDYISQPGMGIVLLGIGQPARNSGKENVARPPELQCLSGGQSAFCGSCPTDHAHCYPIIGLENLAENIAELPGIKIGSRAQMAGGQVQTVYCGWNHTLPAKRSE